MKKLFISMFALAAVITSCSKSEVMNSRYENIPISFTTYNGRTPEVKAAETNKLTEFYVWADLVVDNNTTGYFYDKYNNSVGTTGFEGGDKYWPQTGNLNFYAFAPVPENYTPTNKSLDITISNTIEDQIDIVAATALNQGKPTGETSETNATNLTFTHILSRVHFTINADDFNSNEETALVVNSLKLNGAFINKGTYNFNELTLSNETTDKTTSYQYTAKDSALGITKNAIHSGTATDENSRYIMILPQTVVDPTIEIEYTLNGQPFKRTITYKENGEVDEDNAIHFGTKNETTNNIEFTFTANNSYKFALKLSSDKISFEATVSKWTENGEDDQIELI